MHHRRDKIYVVQVVKVLIAVYVEHRVIVHASGIRCVKYFVNMINWQITE